MPASFADRLSLSTCWCSHRHDDGYAMACEVRELGFARMELSHGVPVSLVPGVLRALEEGVVSVSSVHNFCPLPVGISHAAPNLFEPSAKSRTEGARWARYTKRTVDFADRVGAAVVVLHSGSVPRRREGILSFPPGRAGREQAAMEAALRDPGSEAREEMLAKLERSSRPFLERVRSRFEELAGYAAERGVALGVENREGWQELPLDGGLTDFFADFAPDSPLGYWHDTGHAEIKRRAGLLEPEILLESLSERLLGFHLHDVDESGRDHCAPGTGSVDFDLIRQQVRPHHH
ncbi:MAG: sugar phosphate isomerase/epimerase, partial [Verrucomicrobiaceae bacterium]|nr:sugar phosphate isomerase/epimerase [Verrucomicrobiaceae bacterium]